MPDDPAAAGAVRRRRLGCARNRVAGTRFRGTTTGTDDVLPRSCGARRLRRPAPAAPRGRGRAARRRLGAGGAERRASGPRSRRRTAPGKARSPVRPTSSPPSSTGPSTRSGAASRRPPPPSTPPRRTTRPPTPPQHAGSGPVSRDSDADPRRSRRGSRRRGGADHGGRGSPGRPRRAGSTRPRRRRRLERPCCVRHRRRHRAPRRRRCSARSTPWPGPRLRSPATPTRCVPRSATTPWASRWSARARQLWPVPARARWPRRTPSGSRPCRPSPTATTSWRVPGNGHSRPTRSRPGPSRRPPRPRGGRSPGRARAGRRPGRDPRRRARQSRGRRGRRSRRLGVRSRDTAQPVLHRVRTGVDEHVGDREGDGLRPARRRARDGRGNGRAGRRVVRRGRARRGDGRTPAVLAGVVGTKGLTKLLKLRRLRNETETPLAPDGGLQHHEDAGGHTLAPHKVHIGTDEEALFDRIQASPHPIQAASSYFDRAVAEQERPGEPDRQQPGDRSVARIGQDEPRFDIDHRTHHRDQPRPARPPRPTRRSG